MRINTNHFLFVDFIGDNIVDSYLCRGTGGGGKSDKRNSLVFGGNGALKRYYVGILRICDYDAYALRSVHNGASAYRHKSVRAAVPENLYAVLDVFNGGVGLDFAVSIISNAGLVHYVGNFFSHAAL